MDTEFETELYDINGKYSGRWLLLDTGYKLVALRQLPDLITEGQVEILQAEKRKERDSHASSS